MFGLETILKCGLKNNVFVYNWHYKHENLCGIVLTKATFAYDTTTQGPFFVLAWFSNMSLWKIGLELVRSE